MVVETELYDFKEFAHVQSEEVEKDSRASEFSLSLLGSRVVE